MLGQVTLAGRVIPVSGLARLCRRHQTVMKGDGVQAGGHRFGLSALAALLCVACAPLQTSPQEADTPPAARVESAPPQAAVQAKVVTTLDERIKEAAERQAAVAA